jgi:hypothetical protein
MNDREVVEQVKKTLSIEEASLILNIREIEWGQTTVEIQRGKPSLMRNNRKDIKLTK